ncbi:hypothetical protein V4V35_25485 [Bacillus infantis]|uniref:hypothetical protein n=1 Tax=Bacillus infantis TaxID=324767 RepID=UPI002FBDA179
MKTIIIRLCMFLLVLGLSLTYLINSYNSADFSSVKFDPIFRYGLLMGVSVGYFSHFIESVIASFIDKRKTRALGSPS